ncbi:MAG TPA: tetratricopeptide repeat protein [Smithellaceae bacterium]|nr:tetratricopeptide repeat protein [Smithellaceae bacterium]
MADVIVTAYQKKMMVSVGLILLPLVVYWNIQNFGFINYDDNLYVTENDSIQSGLSIRGLVGVLTDTRTGNWHPVTMISHAVDWELFGQNAGGHHWHNLVLHAINTVLLFLLLNQMTGAIWRSAMVAALFAIHPINVESVAWVSERKNVLSTFFWFLTMLFYVWYVRKPGWKRYLPVFVCFALGLMSKPMLVTLPFVMLLMDYWPLNRTAIDTQSKTEEPLPLQSAKARLSFLILEKIPLFILTIIFSGVALYTQQMKNAVADFDFLTLNMRIANAILSYVLYLENIIWPLNLAIFYPMEGIPLQSMLLAAAVLIFITIIFCFYVRKYPYLAVGWFWYLGTLVPVIGLVQVGSQSMADRYAYVPVIGVFLALVFGATDFLKKFKAGEWMMLASLSVLATSIYFTHQQVQYWKNNYTLYAHAIKTVEENVLLYQNLGIAMISENRPEEAAIRLRKAISLNKTDPALRNSLGVALTMMGKYSEAEEEYKKALQFDPTSIRARNNLGMLYLHTGRNDEALVQFQETLRLQPRFANAHYRLAVIFKRKGLNEKASYHYQEAIRINPEYEKMDF